MFPKKKTRSPTSIISYKQKLCYYFKTFFLLNCFLFILYSDRSEALEEKSEGVRQKVNTFKY